MKEIFNSLKPFFIKKQAPIFLLAIITSVSVWGQIDKHSIHERLELNRKYKELSAQYEDNPSSLTEQELEFLQDDENSRDPWDISEWGCSWYCGGGPDSIWASSELKPFHDIDYKAENIFDDYLKTAWIEGVPGYGIGESITFRFLKESPPVTDVTIYNGYMKSEKTWQENSRVKQLKVYVNGKFYITLNLDDAQYNQNFTLAKPPGLQGKKGDLYLKFEITDIYKGDKYDDVAISDFVFNGTGVHCFAKGTMISVPDGEKPIEQLRMGDKVLTLNTITNKIETATVLNVASQKHHNLYELDFGDIKIKATDDHPFYSNGKYYSITENSKYGLSTHPLIAGQDLSSLKQKEIKTIVLQKINKLNTCEETFTITELDKNKVFFANGICVMTE
ncbi:MAG: Hint domain-containing protein [Tannerella sp.]|jgi:hypothetical protein|nr:Hint domain-containing protein [Tannerella sp.]